MDRSGGSGSRAARSQSVRLHSARGERADGTVRGGTEAPARQLTILARRLAAGGVRTEGDLARQAPGHWWELEDLDLPLHRERRWLLGLTAGWLRLRLAGQPARLPVAWGALTLGKLTCPPVRCSAWFGRYPLSSDAPRPRAAHAWSLPLRNSTPPTMAPAMAPVPARKVPTNSVIAVVSLL